MLYIEKIEINSFGCISDKVFSFDKGFNLVFGNNESGKTTLLSFVLFAFYGTKIKKQPGNLLKISTCRGTANQCKEV